MKLETLAKDVGCSYSYMGDIERGRHVPRLAIAMKICEITGLSPYDFLAGHPIKSVGVE